MRFTPKELLDVYRTDTKVVFEDNEIIFMTHKEIIHTRYILDLLVLYPEVKITSGYAISRYYTNGIFTSKTINKCYEFILKDIVDNVFKVKNDFTQLSNLQKHMFDILNTIYNDIGCEHINYSTSTNILDYVEIQSDERLLSAIDVVREKRDVDSINNAYDVLDNILTNDPNYKHNAIAKAYVGGMVNPNQIKQLLGPRGYVTEIDGSLFKYPIASSFTLGLSNMYDMAIESRSGAKALFLSNKAVQDSEYLARELQLVTMVVQHLEMTDCGNKEYVSWYVRPATDESKGDLHNLVGKRYLDEDTNTEKIISNNDTHLIGTSIKLRSAIKCKLKNSKHICSACFGELSYGIHDHSNLGHYCTSTVTQKITQSILSTKHLTSSATTNSIKLEGDALKFFTIKEKNGIAFRANVLGKKQSKMYIIITQQEAFGIKDIVNVKDIPKIEATRVSRIESLNIVIETRAGRESYIIPIKDGGKYGSFTHKFLEYIVTNGYKLDDNDRYIIDVSNWTYAAPIIVMPELEFSFLELAKNVKTLLKRIKISKGTKSVETPETMLQKLFDMLNSKLDINIALLEVMIYAFTIKSYETKNFELARGVREQEIVGITDIMPNRSLGGLYAWEYVVKSITNSSSFRKFHRVNHPLDVMVKPNEVLAEEVYEKGQ